jgi:hypothetical protein
MGLSNSMLSERLGTNEQLQLMSGSRKTETQLKRAINSCWELRQAAADGGTEVYDGGPKIIRASHVSWPTHFK